MDDPKPRDGKVNGRSKVSSQTCFVVMPISDVGYEDGHFRRVFDHFIAPACRAAGLAEVKRADDVRTTNYIVVDIVKRIVDSDIVVCDLSGKNPNVMFELGLRQAFDLPVVLIQDQRTDRIFDIQGLRTLTYNESLRVDCVGRDINELAAVIAATRDRSETDINSLVKLLGIAKAAAAPSQSPTSRDTALILRALDDMGARIGSIENGQTSIPKLQRSLFGLSGEGMLSAAKAPRVRLPNEQPATIGEAIYDGEGNELGRLISVNRDGVVLKLRDESLSCVPPDDERYAKLTTIPF